MEERKLLHERTSGQALVGAFVLFAALVFGWLLLAQRDRTDRYSLVAEFDTISNLSEGTKVKLRGFPIGQVERIAFYPQPPEGGAHFLVEMGIDRKYPVFEGAVAEIRSSGLVGESYIHLDVSRAGESVLPPGSHIPGRDKKGMKELISTLTDMGRKMGRAAESIRRAEVGRRLGRLGDSMHQVASTLDQVSRSADSLLTSSRKTVERLEPEMVEVLAGLDRNLDQMNQTLQRTDTLVAATRVDLERTVRALRRAVERLDQVLGRVEGMVERRQADIDETLDNLHAASKAVREISEHPWKLITGQGEKGSGPAGNGGGSLEEK